MNMHRIAVGITLGLILTVATSWAGDNSQSKQRKIKGSFSGSFIPSGMDLNNDGQKASINLVTGTSNVGPFTSQSTSEYAPALPAPVTCPSDTVEYPLAGGFSVDTDPKTGDQLFGYFSAGTLCINPTTGVFSSTTQVIYFGGTGRNTGATGSSQASTTGLIFLYDPVSGGSFGSQTGTFTAMITFP